MIANGVPEQIQDFFYLNKTKARLTIIIIIIIRLTILID